MRVFLLLIVLGLTIQPFAFAGAATPKPATEIPFNKKELKKELKKVKRGIIRKKRTIDPEKQGRLSARIFFGGLLFFILTGILLSLFVGPALTTTFLLTGILGMLVGGIMSMIAVPRMKKAEVDRSSKPFQLALATKITSLIFGTLVALAVVLGSLIQIGG